MRASFRLEEVFVDVMLIRDRFGLAWVFILIFSVLKEVGKTVWRRRRRRLEGRGISLGRLVFSRVEIKLDFVLEFSERGFVDSRSLVFGF